MDETGEFIDLETSLTIFELLLLFKVATNDPDLSPFEPIWSVEEGHSIRVAPFLRSQTLMQLALQQRLVELSMLELRQEASGGMVFHLTPRGTEAVNWWLGTLEDMGFSHKVLAAD